MQAFTCEKIPGTNEYLITIVTAGRRWVFGRKFIRIEKYKGNSTIWYNADTGKRCSVFVEAYLFTIWLKEKFD